MCACAICSVFSIIELHSAAICRTHLCTPTEMENQINEQSQPTKFIYYQAYGE